MKTEYTKSGWKHLYVDVIEITGTTDKPYMCVEKWVGINTRLKINGSLRCHMCKVKYDNMNIANVYLLFTNKGNKVICENCQTIILKGNDIAQTTPEKTPEKTPDTIEDMEPWEIIGFNNERVL